jgi:TPR repeat protein
MVGAEPVLEKDEREAYEWALKAAQTGKLTSFDLPISALTNDIPIGFAKAEYAVGYFTEMGIGCRRDPLGANYYYVQAAEKGNENAKQRLKIIHEAASGGVSAETTSKDNNGKEKKKFMGLFK